MSAKISVIVPVYKIERYISECVNSILNQTYTDFEVLLIDDGSPDNSGRICDEFAAKDDRVKVFHKENGGIADVRNFGIAHASGEYISFIDGDDCVDKRFLEKLMDCMEKNDCDIVECHSVKFKDGESPCAVYSDVSKALEPKQWLTESNLNEFISCVVWNKLCKKELFEGISFPTGRRFEDEATTYKVVYNSQKIIRLDSVLYFYRQRGGSITQASVGMSEIEEKYMALEEKCLFFDEHNEEDISDFCYAKLAIFMVLNYRAKKDLYGAADDWRKSIKTIFLKVARKKSVPLKYKLYLLAFLIRNIF